MRKLEVFGVLTTVLYGVIIALLIYLNWSQFALLQPNEWGDFFAGVLGPVAIFWLILGFFLQGRELQNSVAALQLQAEELKNSVEQQKAMVVVTERQLELDVAVREEQIRASIAKELPYLQMRGGSISHSGQVMRHEFFLRNLGAMAMDIRIDLDGELRARDLACQPEEVAVLESGKDQRFDIVSLTGAALSSFDDIKIKIGMRNIRQVRREMEFRISKGQPILLRCDPEQV